MKWAIVGFGSISKNKFVPALEKVQGTELSAIVTGHPESAEEYKKRGVRIFKDLNDLKGVDIVYIATPNAYHREQTEICARKGINVFCEKPMAMNLSESEEMVKVCEKYGITLGIAHMGRFNSYNIGARNILQSGRLGKVSIVKASFSFVNTERDKWRYDPKLSGGGAIMDIGVHLINSLRFFLNDEITELTAINDNLVYDVDQNAAAVMKFSNGAIALVDCSFDSAESVSFEFRGDKALMYVVDTLFQNYTGKVILKDGEAFSFKDFMDREPYVLEIEDMERAVRSHVKPKTDGYDALNDMKVIEAWYRSARDGKITVV